MFYSVVIHVERISAEKFEVWNLGFMRISEELWTLAITENTYILNF